THRVTSYPSYIPIPSPLLLYFLFNTTSTTEIYTLSLHDALPILMNTPSSTSTHGSLWVRMPSVMSAMIVALGESSRGMVLPRYRSEEHTSELQSRFDLVCRLLLEKKKKKIKFDTWGQWMMDKLYS